MAILQMSTERLNPLTQTQVEQYDRDGYLLVEQACSPDLINAYNSYIHTIRSAEELPEWDRRAANVDRGQRFSVRLFNPHRHDGFSLEMMKLPVVRGALAQLLGDEAVGVQSMYFYKSPGSPGQAIHQDFFYIENEPNTITAAYIACDDIDEENGCLWVIPGSHKWGLLEHGAVTNPNEHEPQTKETIGVDLSKEIPVRMKIGDILFFHGLLCHSSTRNRSVDRWRRSYVCHYIRHDSVVTRREDLKRKYPLY
jgi:phytanoyl-CoA hydroxylase